MDAQILIRILTPILISLAIGLLYSKIYERNSKSVIENLKNEHIIIRLPKAYFWVGFIDVVFFSLTIVLMTLFPNDTATWVPYVIFSAFILLGGFIIAGTLIWKIEIFRSKDYFIYRTTFCRIYKIQYSECISYKYTTNTLTLKTTKKTFYIDTNSTNFEFLLSMLRQYKTKEIK